MTGPSSAGHEPATIVIPAHDEAAVVGRLLRELTARPSDHDIVVVCNGCTDDTADVARRVTPGVRVLELEEPSKHAALRAGDAAARTSRRVFLDADVEITLESIDSLVAAFDRPGILAAGPRRVVPRDGVSWPVRWYYDVWESLPVVRSGLFGRGVIALSAEGNERVRALPAMMGDDLVISESFDPAERVIVDEAVVVVHPPRTVRALHRRRVRAATGNAQADTAGLRGSEGATSFGVLVDLVRQQPRLAIRMPVFVGISVAGKIAARRAVRAGDYVTWRRDDTSRV